MARERTTAAKASDNRLFGKMVDISMRIVPEKRDGLYRTPKNVLTFTDAGKYGNARSGEKPKAVNHAK